MDLMLLLWRSDHKRRLQNGADVIDGWYRMPDSFVSITFPLEVMKRCTSVVPRVDEVVVGEDGGVRVAHDQHGATAEVLRGFIWSIS